MYYKRIQTNITSEHIPAISPTEGVTEAVLMTMKSEQEAQLSQRLRDGSFH